MPDKHLTVENADGASATSRWRTTETYKVSAEVAAQFEKMKTKPEGRALKDWIRDHGGVLDDGNGKAGKVSTKNNGAQLIDHYKDGERTTTDYVRAKGAKGDKDRDNAGAELLLFVLTGGASLFIPRDTNVADKKPESKFGNTAAQTATADGASEPKAASPAKETKASTGPATTRPKP